MKDMTTKNTSTRVLVLLALFTFTITCQKSATDKPSQEWQEFAEIWVDYLAVATSDSADLERREIYLDSILTLRSFPRERFDQQLAEIQSNPEKLSAALASINPLLQEYVNSIRTPYRKSKIQTFPK